MGKIRTSNTWRLALVLTAAWFGMAPTVSRAQTADQIAQMLDILKKDGCDFRFEYTGTISRNYGVNREFMVLWVWTSDCGHGTVGASVDVFRVDEPSQGAASVTRMELSKSVVDQTTFKFVKGARFKDDPNAATLSVEVDGLSQSEKDPRCCASNGRRVKLWIDGGKIKSAVIKTWKETD